MSLATHIAINKGTAPTNPSKEPEKKTLWYQKPVVIGAVATAAAITVEIIFRKEIGTLLFASSKNQDHQEKANNFQKNSQKKTETFFDKILQFTETENKLSEGTLACRTLFYNPDTCKDLQKEDSTCAPTCESLTEEAIDQQEAQLTAIINNSVCKLTSDFSSSGYFCAYSVAGMLSIKDKIENAALFLKEKICAEQDLPAHKKELLQAEVDSDILSKLTEGQRQGALCYSKAISTLIKEKSTNIENLIKLTPDQRKMLFKEHLSAVQKLIEHKIPLETLAALNYKLESILTNYKTVVELLKAGVSFEALVNSSKWQTLLESKHTTAILDLLATKKIPLETFAKLDWKLESVLTNYKTVIELLKAGASFEALVNSSKWQTLLAPKHTTAILDLLATKKIPFETFAKLDWKLERILTNYKTALKILNAGADFVSLVNSSKWQTLLASKYTPAILDLLKANIPFETLAELDWKLERILTNYKAVCSYIKDKDNLDILSMNEDKFKKALKAYL